MASALSSPSPPPGGLLDLRRFRGAAAAPMIVSFPRGAGARRVAVAVGMKRYKGTAMREEKLAEMIEKKVAEAMELCGGREKDSDGCRVAWDEVEEVSQAKAHFRRRLADAAADPLEPYCRENPDTDECVVCDDADDDDRR